MPLTFDYTYAKRFLEENALEAMADEVAAAHKMLEAGNGPGSAYLGWLRLPLHYDRAEFARIKAAAARIQQDTDVFVVIGIGGSYLGARAAIEFLKSPLYNALPKRTPDVYFAGNSISGAAISELLRVCEGKRVSVNVISKSGTTTEPAIAFRVFREFLEAQYGKQGAARRIYCTTDRARGTLKQFADEAGYECFAIPDDVGGRFSVLTPVGLLPIAVCGGDIDALMAGAAEAVTAYAQPELERNPCYQYAALRNCLYRGGTGIELLVSYEPRFAMMTEWFKQLFGESEGKNNKGLYPSKAIFSTDLHSMGQYIQEGRRILFETVVRFAQCGDDVVLRSEEKDVDGLNFLAGKSMSLINQKAFEGTVLAHTDGGVPNLVIGAPGADETSLGWLIYFFEKACAVSGYLLGVNPFDQPGVERYKQNMFALLGKPGYEDARQALEARLNGRS